MTLLTLALLLAAGVAHAGWNYIAKRAGGGAVFAWMFSAVSCAVYFPLVLWATLQSMPMIGPPAAGILMATIVVHLAYFLVLQRGYLVGDLSLVYPLARGTGPALAMLLAVILLGERPSWLVVGGGLLITGGVFALAGGAFDRRASTRGAIAYGLATGAIIAVYTLVDKLAVSAFQLPPLLVVYLIDLGRFVLLAPVALGRRGAVRREWHERRGPILALGILCPLSYILALTAMVTTPVSYVAPAREVSILIGTLMGTRWLAEGEAGRRIPGAVAIVAGLAALSAG
jgi:drug/metabolite transporter (DMT)-like permease